MSNMYVIGVGAQKAGTSWLADYLSKHPDVCFSPRKELHVFDDVFARDIVGDWSERFKEDRGRFIPKKEVKWLMATTFGGLGSMSYRKFIDLRLSMNKDLRQYIRYFEHLRKGHKYCAEITPSYSVMDKNGFAAIRDLLEDVRIIFIMRNPADRFWSNMRHIQGKHDTFDPASEFKERLTTDKNVMRTDYKRTIEALESVFEPKDILYLFYEFLFQDEGRFAYFKRIPEFLEIKNIQPKLEKSVNRSLQKTLAEHDRKEIIRHFAHVYEFVHDKFDRIPQSWMADIETYNRSLQTS